jgi:hypothetical protein
MQSLLVGFGKSCVSYLNVVWHFQAHTIHKPMVLQNGFIVVWNKFCAVIAVVYRINGVSFWHNVNLH